MESIKQTLLRGRTTCMIERIVVMDAYHFTCSCNKKSKMIRTTILLNFYYLGRHLTSNSKEKKHIDSGGVVM